MNTVDLEQLQRRVRAAGLFRAIGTAANGAGARICTWKEWAGPEDDSVVDVAQRISEMRGDTFPEGARAAWEEAESWVVGYAAELVPYIEGEDAWYGPNSAVWWAATVYCLENAHNVSGDPLPAEIAAQIYWFDLGHWPCGVLPGQPLERPESYVVL
jgi:hypothetical protein